MPASAACVGAWSLVLGLWWLGWVVPCPEAQGGIQALFVGTSQGSGGPLSEAKAPQTTVNVRRIKPVINNIQNLPFHDGTLLYFADFVNAWIIKSRRGGLVVPRRQWFLQVGLKERLAVFLHTVTTILCVCV